MGRQQKSTAHNQIKIVEELRCTRRPFDN